jgi:hypothetical protein
VIPSSPLLPCASRDHVVREGVPEIVHGRFQAGSGVEWHRLSTPERVGGTFFMRCSCGVLFSEDEIADLPTVCPIDAAQTEYFAAVESARRLSAIEERELARALATV